MIGVREGTEDGPPVVMGSHIDTVATGGLYDGALGVLGGLEVISVLNDAGITTRRPVAVAFFTNEEGSRFHPDMVGSAVQQGRIDLDSVLATVTDDGTTVGRGLGAHRLCGPRRRANFGHMPISNCISSRARCWTASTSPSAR